MRLAWHTDHPQGKDAAIFPHAPGQPGARLALAVFRPLPWIAGVSDEPFCRTGCL